MSNSEVVFIEGNVPDLSLLEQSMGAGRDVYVLDPSQDGLAQIASILTGRSDITALHLVTHGADGEIGLGSLTLDAGNLEQHLAQLQAIGGSLSSDADILLYGCDVGAGTVGQNFVDKLAAATKADVAASSNLTGSANLGGDWNLEIHSGDINAKPAVDAQLAAHYTDVLALTNVTLAFDATSLNVVNAGAYATYGSPNAAANATYDLNGNPTYRVKIDGANEGTYIYGGTNKVWAGAYFHESLVTITVGSGDVFTPGSLAVRNYQGDPAQTLVFKGYDAANTLVASQNLSIAGSASANVDSSITFSGFTNITTLKISSTTNGNLIQWIAMDDLVFTSVSVPDTTPPTVSGVTASTANGAYKAGDVIAVQVNFSEAVNVTGTPQLTLETGTTDRVVNYSSGTGTSTLTFNYTVQAGDTSADLDYLGTTALALNGGTIKDLAGNAGTLTLASPGTTGSLGANKNIVIDTAAPTTTIATMAFSADTGSSSTDFITNTAAQTISGTTSANIASGESVQVSLDNGSTWSTATTTVGLNTWSLSTTLASSNTLQVRVTDTAGNSGSAASQAYVLDTTAPTTTISTMSFSADTGSSSTDFITSTAAQTISGTTSANIAAGESVQVSLDNGSTWSTATTTVGQNTWSLSGATLTGSDTLQVRVTDTAGNSGSAASQAYALDTTAPTTTISTMAFSADTGSSSTDFITNAAAQTISGTTSANIAAGESVEVSTDNGSTWTTATTTVGQNTWSLSGTTLTSSDTLQVRVSDAAGNTGSAASQAYVLDTTSPTTTIATMAFSADTGSSSTDFITNTAAQTISGTTSANIAAGESVEVSIDNGSTWTTATTTVGQNTWSISTTLAGSDTLQVRVTDTAGNSGSAASQAYVLDVAAPTTTVSTAAFSADTGASSSDFITYTAGQTISGTLSANLASGEVVQVSTDNGSTWSTATTTVGQNTWSLSTTLTGSDTLKVHVTDAAGNSGTAFSQAYVLDTTAPSAPSTPDMTSGTDTGSSSSDDNTGNTTPTFTGTAEAGSTVTLYDTDGSTVLGTATAAGGAWSITASALGDGSHTLTAKAEDTAGNISSASSGLAVTIDSTAPTVSSVSVPANGDYKAGDSLDFTVNLSEAVTIDTTGGTPRIALTVGSTTDYATYVSGSGTSSLVFSYTVQAGDNDSDGIAVGALGANGGTLKDTAGNDATLTLNSVGSTASVLVDTTAPTVTDAHISISGSNGTGGAFKIGDTVTATWDNTGTGDNNSDISGVTVDFTAFGGGNAVTAVNTSGHWQATFLIGSGSIDGVSNLNVSVTATDIAGNTTTTADSTNATVDNVAPGTTFSAIAFSNDAGSSSTDFVTNSASQTITATLSGALSGGDIVYGSLDNGATWTDITAKVSGTSLTWDGVTLAASDTLELKVADAAGNDGSVASQAYVLDTTAPTVSNVASSTADGNYHAGDVISITVAFSEAVTVTGTPQFTLETGTVDRTISYASGSGTNTLTFDYTVQTGDSSSDLDYLSTAALALNGGAITDSAGNNAVLTLASPGAAGSLGANANLEINVDQLPTGSVVASGTPTQGQVLTADTSGLADTDGLGTFSYQWMRDGGNISLATSSTYTLTQADVGAVMSVHVSYTDGWGHQDAVDSAGTAAVANVNDAPTGGVSITGTAALGQTVSADTSTLADADGLGTLSYQWMSGTTPVGTNSANYTITSGDLTALLTVQVSYVDGYGTSESVTSAGVAPSTAPSATNGNDVLTGGIGNDVLDGGKGRDTMIGDAGNDTYYVDNIGDIVTESPNQGTDTVYSTISYILPDNVENLVLTGKVGSGTGNALDNVIVGSASANTLRGGLGADTLTGGAGADKFVWNSVADSPAGVGTYDVVTDFDPAQDRLILRGIDADVVKQGNQHFHFIGTAAFSTTDATAELRFDPVTHMLYGSVNADANPEFAVQLAGVTALTKADLAL